MKIILFLLTVVSSLPMIFETGMTVASGRRYIKNRNRIIRKQTQQRKRKQRQHNQSILDMYFRHFDQKYCDS